MARRNLRGAFGLILGAALLAYAGLGPLAVGLGASEAVASAGIGLAALLAALTTRLAGRPQLRFTVAVLSSLLILGAVALMVRR